MSLLLTASLLNAWDWLLYSENGSIDQFLSTLRREPSTTTDAIEMGYGFEEWAYANIEEFQGAAKQVKLSRPYGKYLVYGRLDGLKAGYVYDAKYTGDYKAGKFYDSYQSSVYLYLVPEAQGIIYIIGTTKGTEDEEEYQVFQERYERDDVRPIDTIVSDFESWLHSSDLWDVYVQYWTTEDRT